MNNVLLISSVLAQLTCPVTWKKWKHFVKHLAVKVAAKRKEVFSKNQEILSLMVMEILKNVFRFNVRGKNVLGDIFIG